MATDSKKCPFTIIQSAAYATCEHADHVIRRGGSEYDCKAVKNLSVCNELLNFLKEHALPALGLEDDLTSMPHSAMQKIMLGGLAGLNHQPISKETPEIESIWQIVDRINVEYEDLNNAPTDEFVEAILQCKIKRRRNKK